MRWWMVRTGGYFLSKVDLCVSNFNDSLKCSYFTLMYETLQAVSVNVICSSV